MNTKTNKLVYVLILMTVSVLLFDNNFFIGKPVNVVVKSKDIERSGGNKPSSSGHYTLFIKDLDENKYKVPDWLFQYYHIGDTVSVIRSLLFSKAIRIESNKNGEYIKENIGVFNSDTFGRIVCSVPILLCSILLFFPVVFKKEEHQIVALVFSGILTATIIAFYFIFST